MVTHFSSKATWANNKHTLERRHFPKKWCKCHVPYIMKWCKCHVPYIMKWCNDDMMKWSSWCCSSSGSKCVYIQDGRQAAILKDIKNLFDVHNPQTIPDLGVKFQTFWSIHFWEIAVHGSTYGRTDVWTDVHMDRAQIISPQTLRVGGQLVAGLSIRYHCSRI